ncbi:hypothetical protein PPYR_12318 [Photinus pyralis]|uniref:G-protein coupled receptors family 1 profile domain-containing protein n=1 Tax=Photinus pyralis TaxID=7054 RepID=A0A1Y1MSY9_PHOPY|nr:somatostatin receptor type 2 [Photinus pyralis]XP_031349495.1 somatostatin receptor type 2 [Photinus pyralis]XP_031349496.1 somatostatin receptor type 2 [Photinus pyralis]KAB0795479.1 hypothetical protein PPYR_12318 [Photinus pyralis]
MELDDESLTFATLNDSMLASVTPNSTIPLHQPHTSIPASSIALISQEILFAIVCLVGLLGNTLVIYVVIRFSKMQTVTNMYIVNLAIADECFLIGIPFLLVTMIKSSWIFGEVMCKAYLILASINQFTSSIFLFIMSADRYIAVCHPISSPKFRTPFISRCVSVAAWFCSIILIIPIFSHSKQEENWRTGENGQNISFKSCVIVWSENSTENSTESQQKATTFILYSFVFSFAIPLCLTLIFYCLVIQKLKTVGPKHKSKEKKRSHRKVTNLVLTVVTVYVLCWLPYWIAQIAMTFTPTNEGPSQFVVTIHLLAFCLSYSNSAMNPILYAFLSDNFKKSFLKACTCAAGKDVNATLHLENSVFPRKKHASEKHKPNRATSICPNNEDDCDAGLLVSRADASTSAITLTSRSNITLTAIDAKEAPSKDAVSKNGLATVLHPATNL